MTDILNHTAKKIKPKKENVHADHRQRMRNRYMKNGLNDFADHEILELLLFYCIPYKNTNPLAHDIIEEFGSLHNLFDASPTEIMKRCGVTQLTAVLISAIPQLHKRYIASKVREKNEFNSSSEAGEYVVSLFNGEANECFYVLCFNKQLKLIATELIARGTVDGAQFYVRQIIETAIKHHAASIIVSHNHPSGYLGVSEEDVETTELLKEAFSFLGIKVLDHIIVHADSYYSFKENNII